MNLINQENKFSKDRKARLCEKLEICPDDFKPKLEYLFKVVLPKVLNIEDGCTITLHSPDIHRDFPNRDWLCRIEPTRMHIGMFGGWVSQEEHKTIELALIKTIAVALQVW